MFDPLKETITEYLIRKISAYRNKRDLLRDLNAERDTGINDWTISKILREKHSPSLEKIQPLFDYFILQDIAESKRTRKKTIFKTEVVN
jgi:hypothetical protein